MVVEETAVRAQNLKMGIGGSEFDLNMKAVTQR